MFPILHLRFVFPAKVPVAFGFGGIELRKVAAETSDNCDIKRTPLPSIIIQAYRMLVYNVRCNGVSRVKLGNYLLGPNSNLTEKLGRETFDNIRLITPRTKRDTYTTNKVPGQVCR